MRYPKRSQYEYAKSRIPRSGGLHLVARRRHCGRSTEFQSRQAAKEAAMVSDGFGASGRGLIVAAGVVLMGACSSHDGASPQFVQYDSADVRIVVNEDPATATEAWSLGAGPELVIPPTDDVSAYYISDIDIVNLDGVSDDCTKILFVTQSGELPELREGRVMSYRRTIAWADLETGERTPLLTVPAQDGVGGMVDGELRWVPFPWGKRARWAVSGDRVFVATGAEPEVQVWDREQGLTMRIRWGGGRLPVTAEDQRQRERVRSLAIAEQPGRAKYMRPDIHVPDFKPTFWEMLVDDRGNLWVQEYPFWFGGWGWGREIRKDAASVQWRVFNPDGRLLGTVAVPADVDVLAVSGGRMLTLWKDEVDLPYVRIYKLMR